MLINASDLKKTMNKRDILDYLESYYSEIIQKENDRGRLETCLSGYSISINPKTGEMQRGLHSRNGVENLVWQWVSFRDYPAELTAEMQRAGYLIYDKNHNGCVWCSWA